MIFSWIIGVWVGGGLMYIIALLRLSDHRFLVKNRPITNSDSPAYPSNATPGLTVLVPLRNESAGLQQRLAHWQLWAAENPGVQFVLIDDGSSDGTLAVLENASLPAAFTVVSGPGSGKISCWQAALQVAPVRDYYLLMDADVEPNLTPLEPLLYHLASENTDLAMLALGVRAQNFRTTFEALDFVGLHGLGQRLLALGTPILFSSAFTLVSGSLLREFLKWIESESGHRNAAGPDSRWMAYLSAHPYRAHALSERSHRPHMQGISQEALYGLMPAQSGVRTWLQQRARWASQALGAPRSSARWMQALIIFGVLSAHLSLYALPFAPVLAPLWLLKAFVEWRFFRTFPSVVSPRVALLPFLGFSAVFALLLPIAAGCSLLFAGRRHDGRWR